MDNASFSLSHDAQSTRGEVLELFWREKGHNSNFVCTKKKNISFEEKGCFNPRGRERKNLKAIVCTGGELEKFEMVGYF